ncbi:META domain-containing protein [Tabrizicola sp. BL-A-41-H6]|uniref:META domain-containing protein n=1 Tax=Tabrizicola sp. BL-A-41-H6 TaxID=3421107 RepID=UPI003D669896
MPTNLFRTPKLALTLVACLAATAASARDVTGTLAYRERIALPAGAEVLVELSGPGTRAEQRAEAEGQVPLPFALTTEDTGPLTLRAAIFVDGAAAWTSAAVPVAAGEADLDLGTVALKRPVTIGYSHTFLCGDMRADVTLTETGALMRVAGRSYTLAPDPAASDGHFADAAGNSVWLNGNRALVVLPDMFLPECLPGFPTTLPLTLRGNEPGWVATLAPDGITLSTESGDRVTTPLPAPATTAPLTTTFAADGLTVAVTDALCRDTMTGMPYPYAATVTRGDAVLDGCGGDPGTLLQGTWRLASAETVTLLPEVEITLAVDKDRISGLSGCNRMMGSLTLTGEGLTLSPGGMTMMACPEPIMALERDWLALLATVDGFDIAEDGSLILLSGGDPHATLTPTSPH